MSSEAAVRDYLRGQSSVMGLLNNDPKRLNMEWTGDVRATHVTLYRSGGNLAWYVPYEYPAITFHVYGTTRPAASTVADAIAVAMNDIDVRHKPLQTASVESINFLPTPEGVPRYVVTTTVTALTGPTAA